MNEFEKHKKLADHMERMASTGSTGSSKEWQEFTSELNKSLIKNLGVIGDVIDCKDFFCEGQYDEGGDGCEKQCDNCKKL